MIWHFIYAKSWKCWFWTGFCFEKIGDNTFTACQSLIQIHLPASITNIGTSVQYTLKDSQNFIEYTKNAINDKKSYELAICLKEDINEVVGCISLMGIKRPSNRAELAYWVAKKHWNKGIATEVAKAMIEYSFNTLHLNSIFARFLNNNPSSGKVMQKIGMKYVGEMREHEFKNGKYYNVSFYEILRSDLKI